MLVNTLSIACAFQPICLENLLNNLFNHRHSQRLLRPSKLNNDLSELPELTLDVKPDYVSSRLGLHRKEVIQPHLPIRLPCYDFTPVAYPTFGCVLLAVRLQTSGVTNSHGVTGGVYKARERIHRGMLIRDY